MSNSNSRSDLSLLVQRITSRLESRPNLAWLWIISLFFIGQIVVSIVVGLPPSPKIAPDSIRYLNGGDRFPHLDSSQFGYVGYCFVMWIDRLIGAHNWFAVSTQVLATLIAARALWGLTRSYGGEFAGLIASSLFLLNPLVATWTRYVLTETLFYASTVALLVGLDRALSHRQGSWLALGVGLIGTITIRPNGSILIPGLLAYFAYKMLRNRRVRFVCAASIFTLCLMAVASMPSVQSGGGGRENSFVQRTAAGEVFWGEEEWAIAMPAVDPDRSSNFDFVKYAIRNPLEVTRLGMTRLAWELIQVRSSRGLFYNLLTGVTMTAFFFSFVSGVRRIHNSPLMKSVMLISVPYMALIMATWAISEGRFGWWFMTAWIPVCAIGLSHLIEPSGPDKDFDTAHITEVDGATLSI